MKGGLISAIWTVKAYKDPRIDRERGWNSSLMVTRRPEVLSLPISFCELAKDAKAALVCEPCTRTI